MPTGEPSVAGKAGASRSVCVLATAWAGRRGAPQPVRPFGDRAPPVRESQRGYTYLLVLFLVAGLGLLAAETGIVWQQATQREREAELLAIGAEFARALASYRKASPDSAPPERLEQLVEDHRGPVAVRHLRRIYRDPLSGEARWGLERAAGRITGIFSLAPGIPIRQHKLPEELAGIEGEAKRYSDWIFRPVGVASEARNAVAPAGAANVPAQK